MEKKKIFAPVFILIESIILACILVFIIKSTEPELLYNIFYPVEIPIPIFFKYLAVFLVLFGFLVIIWANYILLFVNRVGLRDREPFHIPSSLALTGPYKFSRNPIYFGNIVLIFGIFVISQSTTVLMADILIYLVFRYILINWEEKKLEKEFGQDYLNFKNRVRRWI